MYRKAAGLSDGGASLSWSTAKRLVHIYRENRKLRQEAEDLHCKPEGSEDKLPPHAAQTGASPKEKNGEFSVFLSQTTNLLADVPVSGWVSLPQCVAYT